MTFTTYIELPIEVEFTVLPGSRGSRDRFGAATTPDSEPEAEILGVSAKGFGETTIDFAGLPKDERDRLQREAERAMELAQEEERVEAALAKTGE